MGECLRVGTWMYIRTPGREGRAPKTEGGGGIPSPPSPPTNTSHSPSVRRQHPPLPNLTQPSSSPPHPINTRVSPWAASSPSSLPGSRCSQGTTTSTSSASSATSSVRVISCVCQSVCQLSCTCTCSHHPPTTTPNHTNPHPRTQPTHRAAIRARPALRSLGKGAPLHPLAAPDAAPAHARALPRCVFCLYMLCICTHGPNI